VAQKSVFFQTFGISGGQISARRQLYPTLIPTGEKAERVPLPVYKYNGESILLECYTVSCDKQLPTFRRFAVPSSSGWSKENIAILLGLLDVKILRKVGNYLAVNMIQPSWRLKSFNYTTGRTSHPAMHTMTSMKLSAPAGNLTNNLRPRSPLLGRFTDQLRGCNMYIRQA